GLEAALGTIDTLIPAPAELRVERAHLGGSRQDLEHRCRGMVDAGEHAARLHGHLGVTGLHEGVPQLELLAPVPLHARTVRAEVPVPLSVLETRLCPSAVMTE